MVLPLGYLVWSQPDSVSQFLTYQGEDGAGASGPDLASVMPAAGARCFMIVETFPALRRNYFDDHGAVAPDG